VVNVKNRRRFRLVYATGVLVSISVVTTSYAAEALEEIVVTAQKRTENLQKVPISISAFSGDNLANASITDSTKLPQIVPGINIGNAGPFMEFYIRGVGTDNTTAAAESPTAVYIDGVYVADPSAMVMSMQNVERVEEDALAALSAYSWPGNIRELEDVLERTILFAERPVIRAADLPPSLRNRPALPDDAGPSASGLPSAPGPLKEIVKEQVQAIERDLIVRGLEVTNGNVTRTAKLLKISRKSLQMKMKEFGLRGED